MNTLLLFFAFPVATIIFAIVLEKILRNPIFTTATFFATYLIVTFTAFDANFLVYAIAYTILALASSIIAEIIFRRLEENQENENDSCGCSNRIIENMQNTIENNANNGRYNCRFYKR